MEGGGLIEIKVADNRNANHVIQALLSNDPLWYCVRLHETLSEENCLKIFRALIPSNGNADKKTKTKNHRDDESRRKNTNTITTHLQIMQGNLRTPLLRQEFVALLNSSSSIEKVDLTIPPIEEDWRDLVDELCREGRGDMIRLTHLRLHGREQQHEEQEQEQRDDELTTTYDLNVFAKVFETLPLIASTVELFVPNDPPRRGQQQQQQQQTKGKDSKRTFFRSLLCSSRVKLLELHGLRSHHSDGAGTGDGPAFWYDMRALGEALQEAGPSCHLREVGMEFLWETYAGDPSALSDFLASFENSESAVLEKCTLTFCLSERRHHDPLQHHHHHLTRGHEHIMPFLTFVNVREAGGSHPPKPPTSTTSAAAAPPFIITTNLKCWLTDLGSAQLLQTTFRRLPRLLREVSADCLTVMWGMRIFLLGVVGSRQDMEQFRRHRIHELRFRRVCHLTFSVAIVDDDDDDEEGEEGEAALPRRRHTPATSERSQIDAILGRILCDELAHHGQIRNLHVGISSRLTAAKVAENPFHRITSTILPTLPRLSSVTWYIEEESSTTRRAERRRLRGTGGIARTALMMERTLEAVKRSDSLHDVRFRYASDADEHDDGMAAWADAAATEVAATTTTTTITSLEGRHGHSDDNKSRRRPPRLVDELGYECEKNRIDLPTLLRQQPPPPTAPQKQQVHQRSSSKNDDDDENKETTIEREISAPAKTGVALALWPLVLTSVRRLDVLYTLVQQKHDELTWCRGRGRRGGDWRLSTPPAGAFVAPITNWFCSLVALLPFLLLLLLSLEKPNLCCGYS